MNESDIIQLLKIFLPAAIYFAGSAIAKSGFITDKKQQQLTVDRRTSKIDKMFDGLDRRA